MSLIIPANTLASGGYAVDNSCRFDTNAGMNKTAANGTRTKATFSTWVKRSNITSESILFYSRIDASNHFLIRFTGSEQLELVNRVSASNISFYTTNALYRDPSSWYHIVWSLDSTQGTAGNRIKLFVNGTQVTSFATSTTQSADTNFVANVNTAEYYVAQEYTSGYNYFNGYLAETVWIDGLALAADQFGEFDEDSGIWKPIDVSGLTFGASGFYLDYEDSSNLGNDANGGTDLTENNLAAIDQSTDTCTNNFCTMNPLYPDDTITFSEGNLKLTEGNSWRSAGGTMAVSTGKWFWEVSNVGNYAYIGFADIQLFNEGCSIRESFTTGAATTGRAHSVGNSDGRHYQVTSGGAQSSEYPGSPSLTAFTNSIIGVALNLDDNNFTLYKDGTAMNSGTPLSITAGTYIPAVSIYGNNVSMNFGSPPYAISSGNTDGDGYGNFEYAVPSGYFSLNTKNLAEYG